MSDTGQSYNEQILQSIIDGEPYVNENPYPSRIEQLLMELKTTIEQGSGDVDELTEKVNAIEMQISSANAAIQELQNDQNIIEITDRIVMAQDYSLYQDTTSSYKYSALYKCGNRVFGFLTIKKTSTGDWQTIPQNFACAFLPFPPPSPIIVPGVAWIGTSSTPVPPTLGFAFIVPDGGLHIHAAASDAGTVAGVSIDYVTSV